jgi:hypothetical protein
MTSVDQLTVIACDQQVLDLLVEGRSNKETGGHTSVRGL